MPVPYHAPGSEANSGAIGWLRCIERSDAAGLATALLLTDSSGTALSVYFAGCGLFDSDAEDERCAMRAHCVLSLFRSSALSPVLLFAWRDELPPGTLGDGLRVAVPICLVERSAASAAGLGEGLALHGSRLHWQSDEPHEGSAAHEVLNALFTEEAPLEPLNRVGLALSEIGADLASRVWEGMPGFSNVLGLSLDSQSIEPGAGAGRGRPLGIADTIMRVLAPPSRVPNAKQQFDLDWAGELLPFQQDGVRVLLASDRLLLADDMGLGKTLQAIAALRILRARRCLEACLVVAPASLLEHWRVEIGKWAPELRALIVRGKASDRSWQWSADVDVKLVGYETLRSDYGSLQARSAWQRKWDVVVADEAQRIKNRNETSEAVKRLPRRRSWALTGTPLENREEELASILEFVDHARAGEPRRLRPGHELRSIHRELQLRRNKNEVLPQLPAKRIAKLAIRLNARQRLSYERAEREGVVYLRSLGEEVGIHHVLALITRLKQICNADPESGESAKLQAIGARVAALSAQGHKALVFSQFIDETFGVSAAARHLKEFSPLAITGDTPIAERSAIIDRFKRRPEHRVLVLSLRVGGLGLNLQEASYAFHLDRWWNPAVERQAEDRIHRFGQTAKVNVIKYSCIGTIEERIDEIIEGKQALFDDLVDDVSLPLRSKLSREELFGLFGLD